MSKIKRSWTDRFREWPDGGKILLLAFFIILSVCTIWFLSQSWIVQATFLQAKTFPKASLMGVVVGDLDTNALDNKLNEIKIQFESGPVTLVNGEDHWAFDSGKLGMTLDIWDTRQAVLRLNNLPLLDKLSY